MEFVLIGPGQLGQLLLRQAGRDCLVIGQDARQHPADRRAVRLSVDDKD